MKISFEHFFKAKMGVRVLVMVWSDLSSIATGQVRDVHQVVYKYQSGTENHAHYDYDQNEKNHQKVMMRS